MKYYRVLVNGISYDIEVEEITKESISTSKEKSSQPGKPATFVPQLAVVSTDQKENSTEGNGSCEVKAPMPGIIGAIMKVAGDQVDAGECILLLEAMKLENDVMAPVKGVIRRINVKTGQSVNTGDALAEIG